MKNFSKVMLIIGMVIGSGFASGKEIAVFFSRFGVYSYIFIPFATILFFGVFYWILSHGKQGIQKINSSKFFLFLFLSVSLVFTSSMFAGTRITMMTNNRLVDFFLILCLLIFCFFVLKNGISFLTSVNAYLIPFTIVILIACLVKNISKTTITFHQNFCFGFLFSILYVVMNVSTSSLVMGQIGAKMTKKSILVVSLFSSLILGILLLFINMTILSNPNSLTFSMPLLQMSSKKIYILMRVVIFVGCLTTLLSLIYTTSQSLLKFKIKGWLNAFVSIGIPFLTSFWGFGNIVSMLYPFVSIIGIIFLIPFLFNYRKK